MKVLVVFPEQELTQEQLVEGVVRSALGNATVVDIVKNEMDACRSFYLKDYDLLIVALNIPKTSGSPLNSEEAAGLSFLKTLRDNGFRKPSIVISDDMDRETFSDIQALQSAVPLLRGSKDWESVLAARVRQQLGLSEGRYQDKTCCVDIILDLENKSGDYRIKTGLLN
jgi:DNA-binding NarL/FixJ family response regulator